MARPPVIDYKDVEEAVRMLQDKGKPINPYQVRSVLGKGSEAKILYYLKGMGLDIEYQDEDPLTKRMVNLIRPVVIELNEQYEEQILKEKTALTEGLTLEREKASSYSLQLDEMGTKLDKETKLAESAFAQLEQLRSDMDNETKALAEQRRHSSSLEEKLDAANGALKETKLLMESTKAEHKELVVMLKDEHARTLQGYKEALEQSNHSLDRINTQLEETTRISHKQALELTTLKVELAEAKQQELSFIAQIEQKNLVISEQSFKTSGLTSELEKLSSDLKETLNTIAELRQSVADSRELKTENAALVKSTEKFVTEIDVLRSVIDKIAAKTDIADSQQQSGAE